MQSLGLWIVFPLVSNGGRRLYTRIHSRRAHKASASTTRVESQATASDDNLDNPVSEFSSAHFDVYLLRWCWSLAAVHLTLLGFSRNNLHLMLCTLHRDEKPMN